MKQRVVWTRERKQRFVDVYNQLGHDNATPKKILEKMNEPGLTDKNVNSHLQKYRVHLRRLGVIPQGKRYMNRSSSSTVQDQNVVPLPAQNLTQFQAAGLVQPSLTEPRISVSPLMDQRSISTFGNPTVTFGDGDRQMMMMMMMNNGTTQMLNSVPSGMEPNRFASSEYMCVQRQSTGVWPGHNVQSRGMLLPVADQPSMLPSLEPQLNNNLRRSHLIDAAADNNNRLREANMRFLRATQLLDNYAHVLPRNSFSTVLPTLYQEEVNNILDARGADTFPNQVEEDTTLADYFNFDNFTMDGLL